MVNEEIVKKRTGLRWLSVKQSGVILLHTIRKKSLRATVTTRSRYVQIDTSIPEKVIAETLGHKYM